MDIRLRGKWEDKLFMLSQFMSEASLNSEQLSIAIKYIKWAIHSFPAG